MVQYPVGNVAFYYYTVSELHRDSSKGPFSGPEPQINLKKSDQINLLSKRARAVQENHVAVQPAAGPVPHRPGQGHLHWRPLQAQHGPTEAALQEYPSHQRFLSGIS